MVRWLGLVALAAGVMVVLSGCGLENAMVLDPKGPIASQQKDLIYIATLICLVVIVPVLILAAYIIWRYRDHAANKSDYSPEWDHNTKLEVTWWGVPIIAIGILAIVTVWYTFQLEPSKPIVSNQKPLEVQVISLDWKWLFIYPEQNIATVNFLKIPEDRPVKFSLTSDAPMNSFWIPQLGGQIYTMSGMSMTLHLQADHPGTYFGRGANYSGKHFTDMNFEAIALTPDEFEAWVKDTSAQMSPLSRDEYQVLANEDREKAREASDEHGEFVPTRIETAYGSVAQGLYDSVVRKYAGSGGH